MSNLKSSNRLDEKYAPALASEHVTSPRALDF